MNFKPLLTLCLSLSLLLATIQQPTIADSTFIIPAPGLIQAKRIALKGQTKCRPTDADCNVCASNVSQQFRRAARGKLRMRLKPWRFNWIQKYKPDNATPQDILYDNGRSTDWAGIPNYHIQGFVHTNSGRFPYAASHSDDRHGAIFILQQNPDGKKYLSTIHMTHHRHPSGLHAFGKYVVFGDGQYLRFIDLNRHYNPQTLQYRLPTNGTATPKMRNFGGGLGMVKLSNGDYLVLSSIPGSQDARPRYNRFYTLTGNLAQPSRTKVRFIGESRYNNPGNWSGKYRFSENLSLITECGTGDIYAIHTTGDQNGVNAVFGGGYWRLTKVIWQGNNPALQPVQAFRMKQNLNNCHMRSAASVRVNPHHQMEFACHGFTSAAGYSGNKSDAQLRHDRFYFRESR
jgi:hypothetical protein